MCDEKIELCCSIFFECFPFIPVAVSVLKEKLNGSIFFFVYEKDTVTGFAAVEKNIIKIICVCPDFQKKGYGTSLLKECEDFIKKSGYDKVILGRNETDIFRGAVMNNMSHRFFEKHGYYAYNGCLDMMLCMEDFSYNSITEKYPCSPDVNFKICENGYTAELIAAVNEVEPKWVRNYISDRKSSIAIAVADNNIVGFVAVDFNARTIVTYEGAKTGLIGYVGVLPSMRGKHIGINLVAFATEQLRQRGCTEAFIEYTSLESWYSRAGYEEYLWFWLGEKNI